MRGEQDEKSTSVTTNSRKSREQQRKHYFVDTSSLMLNHLGIFKLASCKIDETLVPRKTYDNIASVLDTINEDIDSKHPNNVYISKMVEWELNNIKDTKKEEFDAVRQARQVIDVLSYIKGIGDEQGESLTTGITLPNGAKIFSVAHDEAYFLASNTHLYEPTRDDRILHDYFNMIEEPRRKNSKDKDVNIPQTRQPKIIIPKNAHKEIVTEDHNFQGLVYDMKGTTGINFNCDILHFERTRNPNPTQLYSGIYSKNIILNLKDFAWASELVKEKSPIAINKITEKAFNAADFKNLDNIVMNQFIRIQSYDPLAEGVPNEFFLRRQSKDYLMHLKYSGEFIDEEYRAKKIIAKLQERKSASTDIIRDKNTLYNLLSSISGSDIYSKQRKRLSRQIKNANSDDQYREIGNRLAEFKNKGNKPTQGKPNSSNKSDSSYSRQQLLETRFNPNVIPEHEQILFMEYLTDPGMGLVSFMAPQGAGKTIFALAAGLRQVRMGLYDKIIYARPVVVTGEDTGYNPGKPSEKIKPLMMSCEDAISKLYYMSEQSKFYIEHPGFKIGDPVAFMNGLFEQNILDYQVLTNMAGRTLSSAFVIMDEAHLLNREQLRLFLGRIGEDSKCVLLGDYAQLGAANADVVRKYNLTIDKLGMSHLIEKVLVNNNTAYTGIYGHISINRPFTRRSAVAGIGNIL